MSYTVIILLSLPKLFHRIIIAQTMVEIFLSLQSLETVADLISEILWFQQNHLALWQYNYIA